ncbi:MAG: HEAT repeat domain-containing protein [Actinomycetota bacterium]|nr:HEAT repeat domain-containing protein [Actinomycetota bacterium]
MVFFCPACWREIKADDDRCPHCGADIKQHEKMDFEGKLINALKHPEPETVLRAVWVLGRIKSDKAIKQLISLFGQTSDPFLKVIILEALARIDTPEALGFIIRSVDSEVAMVRTKARELLDRKYSEKK